MVKIRVFSLSIAAVFSVFTVCGMMHRSQSTDELYAVAVLAERARSLGGRCYFLANKLLRKEGSPENISPAVGFWILGTRAIGDEKDIILRACCCLDHDRRISIDDVNKHLYFLISFVSDFGYPSDQVCALTRNRLLVRFSQPFIALFQNCAEACAWASQVIDVLEFDIAKMEKTWCS